jgi:predicted RNase H-like HicB family nuclease
MGKTLKRKSTRIKIVVERDEDGYVGYPLGMKGVIVGQGDTYDEALGDVKSAIRSHVQQFGAETLLADSPAFEAFIAETEVAL